MKTTLRIAKLELSTLFYSPIAWFLAIVFLFQSSFAYINLLHSYVRLQDLGGANLSLLTFLTYKIFGSSFGVFTNVISKLYLYLPLITMGLISREVSSGTIKLLYSSPIKVSQIVLGKFFAMMAYNMILISALIMITICGIYNIPHSDKGILICGMIGIFCILCTFSAIGLFMSCLTEYQIVAAISTLVVFAALEYVGQLWQNIDFVRDLTYFLSLSGRASHLLHGLATTKDLLYFLMITVMFICFSIIKLKSGRETRSSFGVAVRYITVFLIILFVGYVSSLPRYIGYYDATVNNTQTLTPNTQKVLQQIGNEPLEVTFYLNLLDNRYGYGSPEARNEDMDRWSQYLRFKPNIKLNYVYYYAAPLDPDANLSKYYPGKTPKQLAKQYADTYKINLKDFKTPEEINKIINLSGEQYRCVMQLKFKGKATFLRLFNDQTVIPQEPEITAALKRLTVPLPKIGFLTGEFERSIEKLGPRDYGAIVSDITFRYALINQGFDATSISLKTQEIPKDLTALVIGDPRAAFSPEALAKIQQYIAEGGNLLIAGEGEKKDVLEPILKPLGVTMAEGMLLQTSKDFPLNMVRPLLTSNATDLSGEMKGAYEDSIGVNMAGASALNYTASGPYTIKPLLMTEEKNTWNKKGRAVLDSAAIAFSAAEGDTRQSVSPLLALTRKMNGKEQRIIIAGDADFLTTSAFQRRGSANFVFNTQLFRWFTYGQFPIDASRPPSKDNGLDLTLDGYDHLKIALLWVLPGLLIVFSAVFLIRRKRK